MAFERAREENLHIGEFLNFDEEKILTGKSDKKTGDYIIYIGYGGISIIPVSDITVKDRRRMKRSAKKYDTYFYRELPREELGERLQEAVFGEIKYPIERDS